MISKTTDVIKIVTIMPKRNNHAIKLFSQLLRKDSGCGSIILDGKKVGKVISDGSYVKNNTLYAKIKTNMDIDDLSSFRVGTGFRRIMDKKRIVRSEITDIILYK